jgi:hypothetical protein
VNGGGWGRRQLCGARGEALGAAHPDTNTGRAPLGERSCRGQDTKRMASSGGAQASSLDAPPTLFFPQTRQRRL